MPISERATCEPVRFQGLLALPAATARAPPGGAGFPHALCWIYQVGPLVMGYGDRDGALRPELVELVLFWMLP